MEFTDVIQKRRSNRHYKADKVPDDVMQKLYVSLQVAPTGSNRQDFKFVFVTDSDIRRKLATHACKQNFINDAPIIMAAVAKSDYKLNVAIAVDHMILEATNQGLGTCWIGWFERDVAHEILNVPDDLEVIILVTIGYAADVPHARQRKPIDALICANQYTKNDIIMQD